jgi:hypothetical protein
MPSATKTADPAPTYVTAYRGQKLTGFSRGRITALALAGAVRCRVIPGQYTTYCLQDLERIKAQDPQRSHQPAPGQEVGNEG